MEGNEFKLWSRETVLPLCKAIEEIAPEFGCHVALTGGLLYKDGPRKDADIMLYRIRQAWEIDRDALFHALENRLGIKRLSGFGWCIKAEWRGLPIDFFFPDGEDGADYRPLDS